MTAPALVGPSPSGGGPVLSLTPGELEVLTRIAHGATYSAIARARGNAEKTARELGKGALRKLGAHSMPEAVRRACEADLLSLAPAIEFPKQLVEVLALVAEGRTNAEIALRLGRSEHTVVAQLQQARRLLGARDRAHAAALAVALRLVRVTVPEAVAPRCVDAA